MVRNFQFLSVVAAAGAFALMAWVPLAVAEDIRGDVYTLDTCSVSGEKLGSMGDPIVQVHEGREIRFCCAGCPDIFEKDPAQYIAKIDAQMIAQQKAHYPLEIGVVSGEAFDGTAIDRIVGNRLVRFSSENYASTFDASPAKYLAKLDAAVVAKQTADYPFDVCMVSGEKFAEGKSFDMVVANRLVKLCCEMCVEQVNKRPARFLSMLLNRSLDAEVAEGSDHK